MLRRRNEQNFDFASDFSTDLSYSKHYDSPFKVSVHSISSVFAVALIIGGLLLFNVVVQIGKSGPIPLKIEDERTHPKSFIAERAQNYLKQLASLGPKVTGSYENEVLAVDYLTREINFIIQQANKYQNIELDIQKVSGAYFLAFKPYGLVNVYENVQNVIVRFSSSHNSNHSLLINCHFDSVPTSPGASDDGINCAAMLETMRILSLESIKPIHNIIFLFNGAEENPLQAAHGFITQHKWAEEVRAVINLEAAGSGGREILFQSGPGNIFLIDAYRKYAPHPFGQSVGQDMFESNLIPSDTDFRLFRDFGNVPGLDFAFARNGYVYHTKYDDFDIIPLASYQHVGDNLLALVKSLSDSPDLPNASLNSKDRYVYFDVLGKFMILYTETTAIIINSAVVLFSFALIFKKMSSFQGTYMEFIAYTFLSGFSQVIGWVASITFTILLAFLLDYMNVTMSWYATPRIIFGLYFCPAIAISICCINVFNRCNILKNNLSLGNETQIHLHVTRILWTLILLASTIFFPRSSYVFIIPVATNLITFIIIGVLRLEHTKRVWLYIYMVTAIVQTVISMYFIENIMTILLPITGRFGSDKNPELFIGVISMLAYFLITSFFVPLMTLIRKPFSIVFGLLITFVVTFCLIAFTSYGFPYTNDANGPAPQRFWIHHTVRYIHDESGALKQQDSGYFLLNMDRNSPKTINEYVPEMKNAISVENDCKEIIYCGLPIYTTRTLEIHEHSTWIPAPPPVIHEPLKLQLISKNNTSDEITRYIFFVKGPDHISFYISPKQYVTLEKWSFFGTIPENAYMWNGRPTYFVAYGYGEHSDGYTFWLDFKHPVGWDKPVMDIAVSGKYIHHDKLRTNEYQNFLNKFPAWTHTTAWFASFYSWIY